MDYITSKVILQSTKVTDILVTLETSMNTTADESNCGEGWFLRQTLDRCSKVAGNRYLAGECG